MSATKFGSDDTPSPREILDFWFKETPRQRWFKTDPSFDAQLRTRFEETWRVAQEGKLKNWEASPQGALALVILLDQFPRNMFRGQAQAFSTDALARAASAHAVGRGFDLEATEEERSFFYLPFMHSEDLADQEECLRLTRERLGETASSYRYAVAHRDTIARFGRFPARNKALARTTTAAEAEFLAKNPAGLLTPQLP